MVEFGRLQQVRKAIVQPERRFRPTFSQKLTGSRIQAGGPQAVRALARYQHMRHMHGGAERGGVGVGYRIGKLVEDGEG